MPIYEFYSPDSGKIYSFYAPTTTYSDALPACPDGKNKKMVKLLSGFSITGKKEKMPEESPIPDSDDPFAGMEPSQANQMMTLIHAVYKRDERDVTKVDSQNKPIASVYLDPEEKVIISEGGFDEFPYMAPRFLKSSFEIGYGRSPSMTALADIKMLNKMSEVTIRAAQKQVDPPLLVPDGATSSVETSATCSSLILCHFL